MKPIVCLSVIAVLVACASGEYGRLISQDQVTWIQKDVTTRDQIVARFGPPQMPEVPSLSTMHAMEYESTAQETIEDGKKVTRGTMTVRPGKQRTIAQYFFTHTDAVAFAGATTKSSNFWVCYDEHGVVQSFGFTEMPISSC